MPLSIQLHVSYIGADRFAVDLLNIAARNINGKHVT